MTKRPLLTRELLQAMKRSDLQRVCKERGLKANIRTEEMIELLLDSSPSQSPRRTSRQRAASTRGAVRQPSTRSRLHSTSTVIIHSDTDEDETHRAVKPESEAPSSLHPGPVTRTRKARDAQLRLGVGRPAVAGGSGPRAVTRSVSVARGVRSRSRSGRGTKPPPAPVMNGAPGHFYSPYNSPFSEQFSVPCADTPEDEPQPPSNYGNHQTRTIENGRIRRTSTMSTNTDQAGVRQIVEDQVRPLQRTVASLQRQLQQQASAHSREVAALNDRVMTVMNELRELHRHAESIQLLRSSMEQLQSELSRARQGRGSEPLHDPTNLSASANIAPDGPAHPPSSRAHRPIESTRHSRAPQSSPAFEYPPPPAGSPAKPPSRDVACMLGKRQRSADARDTTVSETDREDTTDKEPRTALHRPSRKRARMELSADDTPEAPLAGPSNTTIAHEPPENNTIMDDPPPETGRPRPTNASRSTAASGQRSGDRMVGDVIFTDQDFDFFDNPTNLHPADSRLDPSPSVENQHPFTFAFPGVTHRSVTSTPVPAGPLPDSSSSPAVSTLPYPERPHSPSPAPIPHRAAVTRPSQSDAFRPFGFLPESRNPPTLGSAIDPTSLLRTPPQPSQDIPSLESDSADGQRRASSNDVGAGLGMTSVPTRVEETPAALVRRTMYGTELEGDTRFGDFGVEGVATGFWTGARF